MRFNPQTYALTTVTAQRRRIFQVMENAEIAIATIAHYRANGEFLLHAFVIMPDHLHMILTAKDSLERAAQLIKGGISFRLRASHPGTIWQPGYHEHRIRDADDLHNQTQYITNNPTHPNYPHLHTHHPHLLDPLNI